MVPTEQREMPQKTKEKTHPSPRRPKILSIYASRMYINDYKLTETKNLDVSNRDRACQVAFI